MAIISNRLPSRNSAYTSNLDTMVPPALPPTSPPPSPPSYTQTASIPSTLITALVIRVTTLASQLSSLGSDFGQQQSKIQRPQPPSSSSTSIISSPFRVKSTSMIFIGPYLVLLQMPTIQLFQYVVFVSGAKDLSHIILPLQYRYIELSRCVRQFRHIMLIKRGGLGHSPLPLSSSSPGSCAVECPCCPHPGRNIPDSWRYVNSENK